MRIRFRRYDLMRIGEGSFVDIYRGFRRRGDGESSRLIKILAPKYRDNRVVRERFNLEFELLQELSLKSAYFPQNPIKGRTRGAEFLAYDYIEGETLLSLLKRRDARITDAEFCCDTLEHLLKAIAFLHGQSVPIVHSDISPENILVEPTGVRLIDLGCSQRVREGELAEKWVGKPSYLSPEQARGEAWDQRSDLYQAGIVFFELLTGERWNQGSSQKEKVVYASSPAATDYARIPVKLRPLLRGLLSTAVNERADSASLCLKRLSYARAAL